MGFFRQTMTKKGFIIIFVTLAGIVFGIFLFAPATKTFYIKNSASYLSAIRVDRKIYQAEDRIGDMQNTIIPSIKIPENLSENFAGILAKEIIGKNNQPKDGNSPAEPGLNMPDPNKIAEEFIANGQRKANENILNITPIQLKISQDNSKNAIAAYLQEAQILIKENLDANKIDLPKILADLNANNGAGYIEKLSPVIIAHEATANKLEKEPVPADLKYLITEEIRLLRITANILRALTNVETDPIATIVAAKQFSAVIDNWIGLQQKFDALVKKLNQT